MATCNPESFGATPANIKWNILRGDSSSIRIEFLEDDEATHYDISDWEFEASAYDYKADVVDVLEVEAGSGYVDITATAEITENWGVGVRETVAELAFDLQVTLDTGEIWTPVIGTILVRGDVTGGSL